MNLIKGRVKMLSLQEVTKKYNQTEIAVDHLTLTIMPGEIFGLLGPNGAGKSTTIKLITGIYPLDGGTIMIGHFNLKNDSVLAKSLIGYVPDTPNVFLHLKGIEYLNFLRDIYEIPKAQCEKRIEELAIKFSMTEALDDLLQNYSHGMRQKILIIGSLLHDPKIWILDEPLTGLDPIASFALKELMREHASNGNTVLFSTHMLEVAEQICDRVGIINKGKLILNGSINEMKEKMKVNQSLEKIFLELMVNENNNAD